LVDIFIINITFCETFCLNFVSVSLFYYQKHEHMIVCTCLPAGYSGYSVLAWSWLHSAFPEWVSEILCSH